MLVSGIAAAQQIDKGDLGSYERHGRFVHRTSDGGASSTGSTLTATRDQAADVVYDKGDRGVWVRDGKFVTRVRTESNATPSTTSGVPKKEGRILDHKTHRHHFSR